MTGTSIYNIIQYGIGMCKLSRESILHFFEKGEIPVLIPETQIVKSSFSSLYIYGLYLIAV
jgi:hypothetical protein